MTYHNLRLRAVALLAAVFTLLAGCGGGGDSGPNEEEQRYAATSFVPGFTCDPVVTRPNNSLPVSSPSSASAMAGDYCTSGVGGHSVGFSMTTSACQMRIGSDGSVVLQVGDRALRASGSFSQGGMGYENYDGDGFTGNSYSVGTSTAGQTRVLLSAFGGRIVEATANAGDALLSCEFGRITAALGSTYSSNVRGFASAVDLPSSTMGTFAGLASGIASGAPATTNCSLSIVSDGTATLTAPLKDFSGNLGANTTFSARLDGDQYDGIGAVSGTTRKVWFFDTPDRILPSTPVRESPRCMSCLTERRRSRLTASIKTRKHLRSAVSERHAQSRLQRLIRLSSDWLPSGKIGAQTRRSF